MEGAGPALLGGSQRTEDPEGPEDRTEGPEGPEDRTEDPEDRWVVEEITTDGSRSLGGREGRSPDEEEPGRTMWEIREMWGKASREDGLPAQN